MLNRKDEILDTAATMFASAGFRTSLKEIADACGILPGSLYHHFESKEAIVVELVERYQVDLDAIATQPRAGSFDERLRALAEAIADCAVRHRAALLMTMYEPPTSASYDLIRVTSQSSGAIEKAMRETLEMGVDAGAIKPRVDLGVFVDRLCKVLLHISLGVFNNVRGGDEIPAIRLRALVDGIAPQTPSDKVLNSSAPFRAAEEAIAGWAAADDEDARLPVLRAAGRSEFGKRGYEATTMRDIAKAAGMSVGSVYRLVGSKDELLDSIMESFEAHANAGWISIVKAEGSVIEKLDALMWLDINLVVRFRDEYMIRLAWLRESPPSSTNLGTSFGARLDDLKSLLAAGTRSGELRVEGPSADIRAWAIFELLWFPAELVAALGLRPSHALARNTLLRGGAPSTNRRGR